MSLKKIAHDIKDEVNVIFGNSQKNKVYSSHKEYEDLELVNQGYEKSVEKLFDVNKWSDLPGISSEFILYDKHGNKKDSAHPEVGDYIEINLPGPLPDNWVVIVDKKIEENLAEFTVSPTYNPLDPENEEIKHFFIDEATSTFRVERIGTRIIAKEIGKNEGVNNKGEDAGNRELINTLIAEGGWAGFQKLQWQKLTDYLVNIIEAKDK